MFDIPEGERELLIPGKRVAAVHLRPAGDPRAHFMPPRLLQAVKRQIFHQKGERPDQAHIALEHAPEARQIIQAGRTKEAAKNSEEHTTEIQSLMRNSYAGFCLKKTNK